MVLLKLTCTIGRVHREKIVKRQEESDSDVSFDSDASDEEPDTAPKLSVLEEKLKSIDEATVAPAVASTTDKPMKQVSGTISEAQKYRNSKIRAKEDLQREMVSTFMFSPIYT